MSFDLAVEVDEEFAHDGDQGDLMRFADGTQALVKGFQNGIKTAGGEAGHVVLAS